MKVINPFDKLISLNEAKSQTWDVIVTGSGMGGSAVAYRLAHKGLKVLIVEKGHANFQEGKAASVVDEEHDIQKRLEGGRWPTQIQGNLEQREITLWPAMGCGVGGSTLLYAAALQRLRSEDFAEQVLPNGDTIAWPYSYQDIQPYYQECESLFSVKGTSDPLDADENIHLKAPPAMCERDRSFFQSFKEAGLHPYRLHVGYQYKPQCAECGGKICEADCKKDAFNTFITPALSTGNLFILSETEVQKIEGTESRVTEIQVNREGVIERLTAKAYVLAAGAYFTPTLLQKSRSEIWPQGIGNSSGLIGRNLMFHICDYYAYWPAQKNASSAGPNKTIAMRDFYIHEGQKYGEFQSTGLAAGYGMILYSLRLLFDQSRFRRIPLIRQLLRIPARIASKLFGEATIFTTNLEDFPQKENYVEHDTDAPSEFRFQYNINQDLKDRAKDFSRLLRAKTKPLRSLKVSVGATPNWGHPCGTCKSGTDPKTSVVDGNCKFHDLENLYVADSSFMPTSGGTNPSLTIAANALRVGDKIAERLNKQA